MTTYMFPGQGSQAKGMGAGLFAQFPQEVQAADTLLGYSIEELCLRDPQQQLTQTEFTQPALFVTEALAFLSLNPKNAAYYIGHSLGEYSALFAAGCFSFIDGLKLVQKRGQLMSEARGGGMLAVINLPIERIQSLLDNHGLDNIDVANHNSKNQVVLSGLINDINQASEILSKEALMCVPLRVAGAFHSHYMQDAANKFADFIAPFEFKAPHTTVIADATAQPYNEHEIKSLLVDQITHPVKWAEIISYLKGHQESEFIEIGPGTVLSRLMAQN